MSTVKKDWMAAYLELEQQARAEIKAALRERDEARAVAREMSRWYPGMDILAMPSWLHSKAAPSHAPVPEGGRS